MSYRLSDNAEKYNIAKQGTQMAQNMPISCRISKTKIQHTLITLNMKCFSTRLNVTLYVRSPSCCSNRCLKVMTSHRKLSLISAAERIPEASCNYHCVLSNNIRSLPHIRSNTAKSSLDIDIGQLLRREHLLHKTEEH